MIYATGDTHGNFKRFDPEYFPEQKGMSREDYLIITGDFGGVWCGDAREEAKLDELDARSFTTLFVDGNHENFAFLDQYPVEEWHGGKIHRVRPNILHLMRGQVFELEGYTFFTMGGAASHDISDGILDPEASDFREKYDFLRRIGGMFRIKGYSWWPEELPSDEEYATARAAFERVNWQVDYVIAHCAPSSVVDIIGEGKFGHDKLTDFFEEVSQRLKLHYWLFGHYHANQNIGEKYVLLWDQIVQVI